MIWRLLARAVSDKMRMKILFNILLETALTQKGNEVTINLKVYDMFADEIVIREIETEDIAGGLYMARLGEEGSTDAVSQ